MALLMGTYYGFFLPQVINIRLEYDFLLKVYISQSLYVIYFLNAIFNPIIYAWFSPDFNSAFREILGLKPKNKNQGQSVTLSSYVKSSGRIKGKQNENTNTKMEENLNENLGVNPST